jgi:predicted phosphodiesterase
MGQKVIILPDVHISDEGYSPVYKAVKKFIRDEKPDITVLLGDFADCSALSHWNLEKRRQIEGRRHDAEIKILRKELDYLQAFSAQVIYLAGNHEDWCEQYLDHHPELEGLIEYPLLLDLKKRKIKWVKLNELYKIGELYLTHGMYINKYHAAKHLERLGCNICYGHCFDKDTEVLTLTGWKRGLDLEGDENIATVNKQSRSIEYQSINAFFRYSGYKQLYHIKSSHVDLAVTDKHGLMFDYEKRHLESTPEKIVNSKKTLKFFTAFNKYSMWEWVGLDAVRLLIHIVTDGYIQNNSIRWHFKKQRKVQRLSTLLDALKLEWTFKATKRNTYRIYLRTKSAKPIIRQYFQKGKILPDFFQHLNLYAPQILEEYSLTDGCQSNLCEHCYQITSAKEKEVNILQALFVTSGYRCNKIKRDSGWVLSINTKKNWNTITPARNMAVQDYNGMVWCVNVDNGTLLVRRNGKTCVTLNTHMPQEYGCSMRMQKPYKSVGLGCLCDHQPAYLKGKVGNWRNGFAILYVASNGEFNLYPVDIINGRFYFNNKRYEA